METDPTGGILSPTAGPGFEWFGPEFGAGGAAANDSNLGRRPHLTGMVDGLGGRSDRWSRPT